MSMFRTVPLVIDFYTVLLCMVNGDFLENWKMNCLQSLQERATSIIFFLWKCIINRFFFHHPHSAPHQRFLNRFTVVWMCNETSTREQPPWPCPSPCSCQPHVRVAQDERKEEAGVIREWCVSICAHECASNSNFIRALRWSSQLSTSPS